MAPEESKSYQLRVRVTGEERERLERLCAERNRGETISDLVREGISKLTHPDANGDSGALTLTPAVRAQVADLAVLLKREPHQVEEACVEGILDLIERRCEVPLIVMETYLHLKYRSRDEKEAAQNGHSNEKSETDEAPSVKQPMEDVALKVV